MVFNSIAFSIFFLIVCLLMGITNIKSVKNLLGDKLLLARHIILMVASYIFYAWWNWKCAFLMLAISLVSYLGAIALDKTHKKIYLYLSVVLSLAALGIFKYFNFFVGSFATMFGIKNIGALNIILPVGISFYTFQSLSYVIDTHRGKIETEKSFIKVALYISFFPQLVAGPIVKANEFLPQLYEDRNINFENFKTGIQYFVFGFFKKAVIADNISSSVDVIFNCPEHYHAISIIIAVIAYSIQIYCDFSGYSDMAIGCAKCLGYDLTHNFNIPYISKNVTEFWKRWHISLSIWLQEYLYIPLGGNRKGTIRTYINLFLTMLIGGLWHGASWTFVIWGALHGAALCLHKIWMKVTNHSRTHKGTIIGNILSVIITYIFVCFCWIFFRAPDFSIAKAVIYGIFNWQDGIVHINTWSLTGILGTIVCTTIAGIKSRKSGSAIKGFYPTVNLDTVGGISIFFIAVGLALALAYTGNNPFIYFQF